MDERHDGAAEPESNEAERAERHSPIPSPPERRYTLKHLLAVAGVMLVIAVLVNWANIRDITSGDRTFKEVLTGKGNHLEDAMNAFKFPDPLGPEDAKIEVLVICHEGEMCHEPLVRLWEGIGQLQPERLRIEWANYAAMPSDSSPPDASQPPTGSDDAGVPAKDAQPADESGDQETAEEPDEAGKTEEGQSAEEATPEIPELGCASGFTINGEFEFELGSEDAKRKVYLIGPMAGAPLPGGEGGVHGWTHGDVAALLNAAIAEQYGEEGELTGPKIQEAMRTATQAAAGKADSSSGAADAQ